MLNEERPTSRNVLREVRFLFLYSESYANLKIMNLLNDETS